jgi:hypothetical protein
MIANGASVVAMSAIAAGADSIFAEAAISLGLPLEIVRPFDSYSADFDHHTERERYAALRAHARNEFRLQYRSRSLVAYEAAMEWVVLNSDLLVAVWDGQPAEGRGGTGQAITLATKLNRPWIHLNTCDFSIIHHSAELI